MKSPTKTIAVLVAAAHFLTQTLWAQGPEASFWAGRRREANSRREAMAASLPDAFPAAPVLRGLASLPKPLDLPPNFPRDREEILSALSHGSIRKLSFPRAGGGPLVVLIQDVHKNAEAQANIDKTVRDLLSLKDGNGGAPSLVSLVGLEGAFTPLDFSRLRAFPRPESVRIAADCLLGQNSISGAAHAAFFAEGVLPPFAGVDDRVHYRANVDAYRNAAPLQEGVRKSLAAERVRLDAGKTAAFSPALKTFDDAAQAYHAGSLPMGEYLPLLSKASGARPGAVELFLRALALEKALDFKRVESDRAALLESLSPRLRPSDMRDLLSLTLAYRAGRLGHGAFYGKLKTVCLGAGVSLSAYPAMDAYVRYALAADAVSAEELFSDVQRSEDAAYGALARTPAEKRLAAAARLHRLEEKLADFSLTPEEWREYLTRKSPGTGMDVFESFYREAEARNRALAANLLKALPAGRPPVAVLVVGGFHADGVTAELVKAGAAVVSFVPGITKVDAGEASAYLSAFTREKTPLEKLFAGEKLSVAENPYSPLAADQHKLLTLVANEAATPGDQDETAGARLLALDDEVDARGDGHTTFQVTHPASGETLAGEADLADGALTLGPIHPLRSLGRALGRGLSEAAAWAADVLRKIRFQTPWTTYRFKIPQLVPATGLGEEGPTIEFPGPRWPILLMSSRSGRNRSSGRGGRRSGSYTPPERKGPSRRTILVGTAAGLGIATLWGFLSRSKTSPAPSTAPNAEQTSPRAPSQADRKFTNKEIAELLPYVDYMLELAVDLHKRGLPMGTEAVAMVTNMRERLLRGDTYIFLPFDSPGESAVAEGEEGVFFQVNLGMLQSVVHRKEFFEKTSPDDAKVYDTLVQALLVKEAVHYRDFRHPGPWEKEIPGRLHWLYQPYHRKILHGEALSPKEAEEFRRVVRRYAAFQAAIEGKAFIEMFAFLEKVKLTPEELEEVERVTERKLPVSDFPQDHVSMSIQHIKTFWHQFYQSGRLNVGRMRKTMVKMLGADLQILKRLRAEEDEAVSASAWAIWFDRHEGEPFPNTNVPPVESGASRKFEEDSLDYLELPPEQVEPDLGAPQNASFANQFTYTALWAGPFLIDLWFLGHHPGSVFAWIASLLLAAPTIASSALTVAYRAGVMASTANGVTRTSEHYAALPPWARTAVDLEEAYHRVSTAADPRHNLPGFANTLRRAWDEAKAKTFALLHFPAGSVSRENAEVRLWIRRQQEISSEIFDRGPPRPLGDVVRLLDSLQSAREAGRVRVMVATGADKRKMMRTLSALGILDRFDVLRPAPYPKVRTIRDGLAAGIQPGEAIMIGDGGHDILSGREAGARTLSIGDAAAQARLKADHGTSDYANVTFQDDGEVLTIRDPVTGGVVSQARTRLFVFDLDGTISDTAEKDRETFRRLAAEIAGLQGRPPEDPERLRAERLGESILLRVAGLPAVRWMPTLLAEARALGAHLTNPEAAALAREINRDPGSLQARLGAAWDAKMAAGNVFNYSLKDVVRNPIGSLVKQFNPDRAGKRPSQIAAATLDLPFNPDAFHFDSAKMNPAEILAEGLDIDGVETDVVANVNPFMPGHVLITPERKKRHNQHFNLPAAKAALGVLKRAGPDYKVAFNSLDAFASINHLHLQALPYPEGRFPVEEAFRIESNRSLLSSSGGVDLWRLDAWPTSPFVFTGKDENALTDALLAAVDVLHKRNQPFNLVFSRDESGEFTVFLFARLPETPTKYESGVAFIELAGEPLFVKQPGKTVEESRRVFEGASEADILKELRSVALPSDVLAGLTAEVKAAVEASPDRSMIYNIGELWPGEEYHKRTIPINGRSWTVRWGQSFIQVGDYLFVSPKEREKRAAEFTALGAAVIATRLRRGETGANFYYGGIHTAIALLLMQAHADLLRGKTVLDAGSGDGVLGTMALRLGAREVIGVDLDQPSVNTARKTALVNDARGATFIQGDLQQARLLLGNRKIDTVLANLPHNGFPVWADMGKAEADPLDNLHILLARDLGPDHYFFLGANRLNLDLPVHWVKDFFLGNGWTPAAPPLKMQRLASGEMGDSVMAEIYTRSSNVTETRANLEKEYRTFVPDMSRRDIVPFHGDSIGAYHFPMAGYEGGRELIENLEALSRQIEAVFSRHGLRAGDFLSFYKQNVFHSSIHVFKRRSEENASPREMESAVAATESAYRDANPYDLTFERAYINNNTLIAAGFADDPTALSRARDSIASRPGDGMEKSRTNIIHISLARFDRDPGPDVLRDLQALLTKVNASSKPLGRIHVDKVVVAVHRGPDLPETPLKLYREIRFHRPEGGEPPSGPQGEPTGAETDAGDVASALTDLAGETAPPAKTVHRIARLLDEEPSSLELSKMREGFVAYLARQAEDREAAKGLRAALERRGIVGEAALKVFLRMALLPSGKGVYFVSERDLKEKASVERLEKLAGILNDYYRGDYLFVTQDEAAAAKLKSLLPPAAVLFKENAFSLASIKKDLAARGMSRARFYASPSVALQLDGAPPELVEAAKAVERILEALSSMPLTPLQIQTIDRAAHAIASAA